jgi:hypothetical protein
MDSVNDQSAHEATGSSKFDVTNIYNAHGCFVRARACVRACVHLDGAGDGQLGVPLGEQLELHENQEPLRHASPHAPIRRTGNVARISAACALRVASWCCNVAYVAYVATWRMLRMLQRVATAPKR